MKLFDFEDLAQIIDLNETEKMTDKLCFDSAYCTFEKYIGFDLEERNYNEIHTVKDNCVYVNQINISEMISIVDMTNKQTIDNCYIDRNNYKISFLTPCENHNVFINYNAGFTKETFPADLKEAIVRLFLIKRNNLIATINNEKESAIDMPDEIKEIFDRYALKRI